MVLGRDLSLRSLAFNLGPSVKVDDLARFMVNLALNGGEKNMWENADIKGHLRSA